MKPEAILVNTARGPVVDPEALYEALKSRQIAYAAIDVTEPEPLPMNSPLLELDNLIITPHIAGYSLEAFEKMTAVLLSKLEIIPPR